MKVLELTRTIKVEGKPKTLPVCVVPAPGMQFGTLSPEYTKPGASWIWIPGQTDETSLIVDQTVAVIKKRLGKL